MVKRGQDGQMSSLCPPHVTLSQSGDWQAKIEQKRRAAEAVVKATNDARTIIRAGHGIRRRSLIDGAAWPPVHRYHGDRREEFW